MSAHDICLNESQILVCMEEVSSGIAALRAAETPEQQFSALEALYNSVLDNAARAGVAVREGVFPLCLAEPLLLAVPARAFSVCVEVMAAGGTEAITALLASDGAKKAVGCNRSALSAPTPLPRTLGFAVDALGRACGPSAVPYPPGIIAVEEAGGARAALDAMISVLSVTDEPPGTFAHVLDCACVLLSKLLQSFQATQTGQPLRVGRLAPGSRWRDRARVPARCAARTRAAAFVRPRRPIWRSAGVARSLLRASVC